MSKWKPPSAGLSSIGLMAGGEVAMARNSWTVGGGVGDIKGRCSVVQHPDRNLTLYIFAAGVRPQGSSCASVPAAAQQADIDDLSKPCRANRGQGGLTNHRLEDSCRHERHRAAPISEASDRAPKLFCPLREASEEAPAMGKHVTIR